MFGLLELAIRRSFDLFFTPCAPSNMCEANRALYVRYIWTNHYQDAHNGHLVFASSPNPQKGLISYWSAHHYC